MFRTVTMDIFFCYGPGSREPRRLKKKIKKGQEKKSFRCDDDLGKLNGLGIHNSTTARCLLSQILASFVRFSRAINRSDDVRGGMSWLR